MRLKNILMIAGLALTSGCVVGFEPDGRYYTYPVPPPVVVHEPFVPDYYVWTGYEYVGVIGNRYLYLGPNHIWIDCEPDRLHRFRTWERSHSDWRVYAYHNLRGSHTRR